MIVDTFEVGPFFENTYLLTKAEQSLVVDPGFAKQGEMDHFFGALEERNTGLVAVVLTHAHVDHVLGLRRLLQKHDVPVYLNTNDLFLWENFGSQSSMFGLHEIDFSFVPNTLPNSGEFSIGEFTFHCLYTPGHSPDHTSFYFEQENLLIAGDVLFRESIGRTDLYKGDFELLEKSIKEKLYTLPDHTLVYPGHGVSTTIEHEKKNNPFVKA